MLHLIDQEAFSRIITPDPRYSSTVTSMFGNDTPYSNDANTGWSKKGGYPEKARHLFKEGGYAGEKVIILQPRTSQDTATPRSSWRARYERLGSMLNLRQATGAALSLVARTRGPSGKGAGAIFISGDPNLSLSDPIGTPWPAADGDKAWYGWPRNDEYEAVRAQWLIPQNSPNARRWPAKCKESVGIRSASSVR
ncbi:hypothetical protein [Phyllobacterium endophyticum]|uniref:hypothetical protein n=1 Tax=Phyllobacterium endophyticum TaxID=1149773 RepID=UPI0011C76F46|nr:hypothetical protein [Phyllobacterium endophyticum]TXR50564.1 hypothetical protein FVA77_04710 [Phyllobacterium endophyticum]